MPGPDWSAGEIAGPVHVAVGKAVEANTEAGSWRVQWEKYAAGEGEGSVWCRVP